MTMGQVRRFEEWERELLLQNWWNPKLRTEICKKLKRTEGSCGFEYYRLLRDKGVTPSQHKATIMQRSNMNERPSDKLAELEARIESQNANFVSYLENMIFLVKRKESIKLSTLFEENKLLRDRNMLLQQQVDSLSQELEAEKKSNQKVFKELDFYLNQFFGLSSVEKLTSLKDFLPRIKTVVDKYGTVVGLAREDEIHNYLHQHVSGN
jgi:hypothetical protein